MKKKKMKKKVIFLFWLLSSFIYGANSSSEVNNLKKISLSEVLDQGKKNVPEYFGEGAALFLEETEKEYLVTIKDSSFPNEWTLNKISKKEEIIEFLFMDVGRSTVKEIIILTKLNQTYKIYSYMFDEYLGDWRKIENLDDLVNSEIKESRNIESTQIKERLEKLPKLDYLALSDFQEDIKEEYSGLNLINPPVVFFSEDFIIKRLKERVYGKFYKTETGEYLEAIFEGYSIDKIPFYIKDGKYQEGFGETRYLVYGSYKAGLKEGKWEIYNGPQETIEEYEAGQLKKRISYDYDKTTIENYKNGELIREEREDTNGKLIFYSNGVSLNGIKKNENKEEIYRIIPKESFWGYRLLKDSYDVVIYDKFNEIEEKVDTYEKGREILSIFYYDITGSNLKNVFILTKYKEKYKIYCYNLNIYIDLDPITFIEPLSQHLNSYFETYDSLDAIIIKKRLESMKKEIGKDLINTVYLNHLDTSKGTFYEGVDFYSGEIILKNKEKTIKYYKDKGIFGEFYNGRLYYIYQGTRKLKFPYYTKQGKFTSVRIGASENFLQEGTYLNDKKNGFWKEHGRNKDSELKELFKSYYKSHTSEEYIYYEMNGDYKEGKKEGKWRIKDENGNEKIILYKAGMKIGEEKLKKDEILEVKKNEKSKIDTILDGLFWMALFIFSFNFSDLGWLGYFILLPTCCYLYIQYGKKYLCTMIGIYSFMLTLVVNEVIKISRIVWLFMYVLVLFIPTIMIVNVLWILYLLIKRFINRGVVGDE